MNVEIVDRGGWKYAKIKKPRGQGRAFFQSLGTQSEKDAREKVRESNLEQIQLASQADAITRDVWTRLLAGRTVRVRDSIQGFKEHRTVTGHPMQGVQSEQGVLEQFIQFTGFAIANENIAVLEAKHISDFINRPGPAKLSTRTWQLQLLNTWMDWNVEKRWLVSNPAIDVIVRLDSLSQEQMVSNPHVAFTDEEVKTLLAAVPRSDFWHGAILLGYQFGLTVGTVARLEESNVVAHTIRVYRTKGRRLVNERLSDELIAWLDEWKSHRPASAMSFLFPAQAAAYETAPSMLSKQFKRLCVKAGIEDRVFHGLRKTATARKWSAELDELGPVDKRALMKLVAEKGFRAVQAMLAHAPGSEVTTRHYMPTAP